MKRLLSLGVAFVFVVLGMAIPAEAQRRPVNVPYGCGYHWDTHQREYYVVCPNEGYRGGYDRGYGRGYGYYDPRVEAEAEIMVSEFRDFLKLPGILMACRLDVSERNPDQQVAVNCRWLMRKTLEALQESLQQFPSDSTFVLGSQDTCRNKVDGKKVTSMCLKVYNDQAYKIGTLAGGAIGAAGGAGIGGAIGDRRGAMAGAVIGGAIGGIFSAFKTRGERIPIEVRAQGSETTRSTTGLDGGVASQGTSTTPVVESNGNGPAFRSGPHPLTNASRVYVDVYDGDRNPENLVKEGLESGGSLDLDRPRGRYRVWALIPNERGGFDEEELKLEPNASGWTFVEPEVAR